MSDIAKWTGVVLTCSGIGIVAGLIFGTSAGVAVAMIFLGVTMSTSDWGTK